ncbi:mRNA decay activator protein ZFP36 [Denticeps clupeoides]|uniref:mRNA decay activator protein ZFP36 n=1 Tax=Denticeps clupeoides TaxID=299321 RepID=A0AAY4CBX4_9TELE|nr:mRNA decay activator protein ZFP36-like [Denticeps clupeoides]
MSDMIEDIVKNLTFCLDDPFAEQQLKPMVPPFTRPFFGPKSLSLSSEDLSDLPGDIWSEKGPYPFRPDRSMSLTDNSAALFGRARPLDVAPPPGFPPLSAPAHSNRYKTELCRSFQESGSCKYGGKCQFAHGEKELRGLHRHPKYKTEACRTFYNFGYCPYGTRCHFIHEEKLSAASPNPRLLRQSVSFAGFPGSRGSPAPPEPLGFSRAPSVSPPPADLLLSPVFPPKAARCVCGNGTTFPSAAAAAVAANAPFGFARQPSIHRFSSEESLSDRESYSSTSSHSGSESPTFDVSGSKRLTVFERLSVSD